MRERDRGYIIVPLLMLLVFIGITFSIGFSRINDQWSLNRARRVRTDLKHLATTLSMIYSNRQSCMLNINNTYLGATLAQIRARSASGNLRLRVPGNAALTIARNSTFLNLRITGVRLGTDSQPFPTEQAFVIPLNVTVQVGTHLPDATTSVPFYFVTDAGGRIRDCYATFYTDPAMTMTMEDSVCKQVDAANIFTAANQFCAADPTPTPPSPIIDPGPNAPIQGTPAAFGAPPLRAPARFSPALSSESS